MEDYERLRALLDGPIREAYAVLGLTQPATETQIMATYRKRARECHPDHGGSAEMMTRLNAAKDVVLGAIRKPA
jgi:curved DNA-binding protein CbpA